MKYIVVTGSNKYEFENNVTERIKEGYTLCGGVTMYRVLTRKL